MRIAHADARLRRDARGCDGGVREELTGGRANWQRAWRWMRANGVTTWHIVEPLVDGTSPL
jgi:hypothetical protein